MAKSVYFASDFHLGIDCKYTSDEREQQIVDWLDSIQDQAAAIYLLGDIFDYWFEYKTVVPKGFNRFFGKLKELRKKGIPIYFFTGNHDMWMFDYFPTEFGIPVYKEPLTIEFGSKKFFLAHGDGLGPGDHSYKMIKAIFSSKTCQWLFARIHPNLGIRLMKYFSRRSRSKHTDEQEYLGDKKEWLVQFCNTYIRENEIDYFVFGHRHLPLDITLSNDSSRYINLGDWMYHNSYAEFDGHELRLKFFKNEESKAYIVA